MTIAAGVWCSDGLVICADTELTQGDSKYERSKIFGLEDWLIVTGSGWSDFIEMTFDKLCEALENHRPRTRLAAREAIEKVVLQVFQKNIASVYQVGDQNSPNFDLLVGIRCGNGELALIKSSSGTSVALVHFTFQAIGVGWPLFEYWGKYFFQPVLRSTEVTAYFCMFILREIKKSSYACGGGTTVHTLMKDPNAPKKWMRLFEEDLLAGFPQTAVNVFLDAADLHNLNFSVTQFRGRAENLRNWFQNQREEQERLKQECEASPVSSASVPAQPSERSGDAAPKKGARRARCRP